MSPFKSRDSPSAWQPPGPTLVSKETAACLAHGAEGHDARARPGSRYPVVAATTTVQQLGSSTCPASMAT